MTSKTKYNILSTWQLFYNGALYAVFQVLNPVICDKFGGDEKTLATLVSAIFLGTVLTVLSMGEVAEHIGPRKVLVLVCACDAIGALLVVFAVNIPMVVAGILLCGFGIGGSESNTYTLIEKVNGEGSERVLLLANAAYGFGGFILPIVIENLFPAATYQPEVLVFGVLGGAMVLAYATFKAIDGYWEKSEGTGKEGIALFRSLKNKVLLVSMAAMFLYCGLESVLTYWAVDVFEAFGSASAGSYAVSAYWLATMIGSILWGFMGDTLGKLHWLIGIGGLFVAGITVFPWIPGKVALMFLTGFCFGPSYSLISYLGGHACEDSASGYSLTAFSASIGGVVVQPLVALIVGSLSAKFVYLLAFAMALITGTLVHIARRMGKD